MASCSSKKEPFRSWPISANLLDDGASGSDTKVKSPTVAVHSICAVLRMNSPAKPPKVGSVLRMLTFWLIPLHTTLNDTDPSGINRHRHNALAKGAIG